MTSVTPPHLESNNPGTCRNARLADKRVALCVTGSIAAYKACEVARLLIKSGAQVQAAMTHSALEFVGVATLAGITGKPVAVELFGNTVGESHVTLSAHSDVLVIAPATADLLARLATGRADDLVTATALCARCPVIVAPAMHPSMWEHPATQRNVEQLRADGRIRFVGPVSGEVASGDVGLGRFADPELILHAVLCALTPQDLRDRHVVVSAGPTLEDLDPVRYLGNRSSGKMGFAIARAAAQRGAKVTLLAGPTHLPSPPDVTRIDVRSAQSMRVAIWEVLGAQLDRADILVMAAAVSDFRFSEIQKEKLKRSPDTRIPQLAMNPDILAEIGAARRGSKPLLVGFAVETDAQTLVASARKKLSTKRVDLVVANLANESLGLDENRVTLVTPERELQLPAASKSELAMQILDWVTSTAGTGG
jgi:phosphopantothenoylcysteine decarboxylase / phosphopantothenate---cysteine ligase